MKDVKVLLTQNIQRAINKANCCGKIPLGRWVPDMCKNVIRYSADNEVKESESDEDEKDEYESKTYVLGDILEELD